MRRRNVFPVALLCTAGAMSACNTVPTTPDAPSAAPATQTAATIPATPAVALATPPAEGARSAQAQAPAGYERALSALRDGRNEEAAKLLADIAARQPDFAPAHINLGIAHFRAGQWEAARDALAKAVQLDVDNAVALNYLGMTYRELGRFDEARDAYQRAMRVNSRYAYAYLNMGILNDLYLRNPKEALGYYQQYQSLTGSQDKEVSQWVVELQRRMQQGEKGTP